MVIVTVNEGKLKGEAKSSVDGKQYYSFKGIPYAKPPVGDLRFAAPEPAESWHGVRNATKPVNSCTQTEMLGPAIGSEDCLYLNVYTPQLPSAGSEPLPVFVYIHGGGFVVGTGTDDAQFGFDYVIQKDVVVVAINYRLNIFGFLCLDRKEAPGNMGLKDQVLALKWIRRNISQFNGNPSNVTLFGISAGAASVEYHLISPMSQGLFHRAIAQSGSTLSHWAMNTDVKKLAYQIAETKGVKPTNDDELYKYLKQLSAEELGTQAAIVQRLNMNCNGGVYFGFVPTIEKSGDWEPFLKENPYEILKKGDFQSVSYLAGCCSDEGMLMSVLNPQAFENIVKTKKFVNDLPFKINDADKHKLASKLDSVYVKHNSAEDEKIALQLFTDIDFLGSVYVATSFISKRAYPIYLYHFSYDGNLNLLKKMFNIQKPGASHGDEGGYIGRFDELEPYATASDKKMREKMVTMWTNFAKYGNPTPKLDEVITTKWEPFSSSTPVYLAIAKEIKLESNLYPERVQLIQELYEKYPLRH